MEIIYIIISSIISVLLAVIIGLLKTYNERMQKDIDELNKNTIKSIDSLNSKMENVIGNLNKLWNKYYILETKVRCKYNDNEEENEN